MATDRVHTDSRPFARSADAGLRQQLDERPAMLFWSALFGVAASFVGALAAVVLRVDVTLLEAAFLGAFLGSTPLILLPNLARLFLGRTSPLADRTHPAFRAFSLGFVVLIAVVRLWTRWPHHSAVTAIADGGLFAALLATWFAPHFPRALRVWRKSQWFSEAHPTTARRKEH